VVELPSLWPHQETVRDAVRAALAKHRRVILCAPCGFGKTRIAKAILGASVNLDRGEGWSGRSLFAVHRRGLVNNASDSFNEEPRLPHGIIMAGEDTSPGCETQVASIDSANSWYIGENGRYETDYTYDFITIDEAHSHLSKFRTFLAAHDAKRQSLGLRPAFVLGLSATPQHKELNKVFNQIVPGPSIRWLIDNGYLIPGRYFQCTKGKLDLLVKRGDEYTEDSVSAAMEGLSGDLVKDWKRLADGRATVGFFPRRSHAYEAMELLRANGIDAHYVDGETPDDDRQRLFHRLNDGTIDYICNVGVIERGTDIPRIGCVQLCTAIGSVVRYIQMIGRGFRTHPAVQDVLVLDHAANVRKHGFFDDPIEWTLEWGDRPAKEHTPRATVKCPACRALYRGGKCRQCGYEPTPKERKAQGLEFVGGELREVTRTERKETKKKSCEELMIMGLYVAGKRGGTWGQAWYVARNAAEKQGTIFRVPATVEVAGRRYRTIPYGHPDAKLRVRDTYGFTVGRYSDGDNPYRVREVAYATANDDF
jgi:superfamily II DNA or RNA helicase